MFVDSFCLKKFFLKKNCSIIDPDEYRRRENSNLVEENYESLRDSFPFIPNIRDEDGHLIMPDKYEDELKDGGLIMLNVRPRMYVFVKKVFTLLLI